ncbi:MAG: SLC13 family permease [Planctomycetota bacterium]|nr:SLC13 family permease [Planctomycetota bacterium]
MWLALGGLPDQQRAVGAVFGLTVAWWITEAIPLPMTSLAATALLVLAAGIDEDTAFGAFGDPIIALFIGSFLLARAMEVTGLGERMAWQLLSRPWASKTPGRLLFTLGAVACIASLILSNTATTAMMLPMGLGLLSALGTVKRGSPYAVAVMLMLTWGSSVAVGVPVGTPPNLIGLSLLKSEADIQISFVEWTLFAMPVTILMLIACWVVLMKMYKVGEEKARIDTKLATDRLAAMGPMSRAEWNTLIAFIVAVLVWIAPDIVAFIWGRDSGPGVWASEHFTLAIGAVVGAFLLFVLPAGTKDGKPDRLRWEDAAKIDWGTIILFGGGIALGRSMAASGLPETMGHAITALIGVGALWTLTAIATAAAILLSELGSNTASASILVPVVIGIAGVAEVSPVAPVLGVALGASLGFMMPVSTPPNAIVYGSGLVPAREMMKAGIVIDIVGFFVTFGCLRLILPLMGLA